MVGHQINKHKNYFVSLLIIYFVGIITLKKSINQPSLTTDV